MKFIWNIVFFVVLSSCSLGPYSVYENRGEVVPKRVGIYLNNSDFHCANRVWSEPITFTQYSVSQEKHKIPFSIDEVLAQSFIDYMKERNVVPYVFIKNEFRLSGKSLIKVSSWDASRTINVERKLEFEHFVRDYQLDIMIVSSTNEEDYLRDISSSKEHHDRCGIFLRDDGFAKYTSGPQLDIFDAKSGKFLGFRRLYSESLERPERGVEMNKFFSTNLRFYLMDSISFELDDSKLVQ